MRALVRPQHLQSVSRHRIAWEHDPANLGDQLRHVEQLLRHIESSYPNLRRYGGRSGDLTFLLPHRSVQLSDGDTRKLP
ncbi:hypothetical protein [Longispora fulva]|uniref:Uncharacterized protein n=1 Tax=Longispora fulva TaxID=619741 RepID=A0A8J7KRD2_9ACTN|nr:hypothetical protein [Longispora fulva]MBG6138417.1 hypothetical protein [Longispora fulva]